MSNTNKYRADLVPVLYTIGGTAITMPGFYTAPCGMNSILELNSKRIRMASILRCLQGRDTTGKAVIISTWRGKDGSDYQGEYGVTQVHICTGEGQA